VKSLHCAANKITGTFAQSATAVNKVPMRYWKYCKSIELQNQFSRPWKSLKISQNMH